jgi:hypothetical protein
VEANGGRFHSLRPLRSAGQIWHLILDTAQIGAKALLGMIFVCRDRRVTVRYIVLYGVI